jgi:hypothetical protein
MIKFIILNYFKFCFVTKTICQYNKRLSIIRLHERWEHVFIAIITSAINVGENINQAKGNECSQYKNSAPKLLSFSNS